jgi:hypothetical protein
MGSERGYQSIGRVKVDQELRYDTATRVDNEEDTEKSMPQLLAKSKLNRSMQKS